LKIGKRKPENPSPCGASNDDRGSSDFSSSWEEGAAEARGGGKFRQPFLAIQESLVCKHFLHLFPEEQHYPSISEWAWQQRRDRQ
jgi:hypothetical protein